MPILLMDHRCTVLCCDNYVKKHRRLELLESETLIFFLVGRWGHGGWTTVCETFSLKQVITGVGAVSAF